MCVHSKIRSFDETLRLLAHRDGETSLKVVTLGHQTHAPSRGGAFAERRRVCHVRVAVIGVHDTHHVTRLKLLADTERVVERVGFATGLKLSLHTSRGVSVEFTRDADGDGVTAIGERRN